MVQFYTVCVLAGEMLWPHAETCEMVERTCETGSPSLPDESQSALIKRSSGKLVMEIRVEISV